MDNSSSKVWIVKKSENESECAATVRGLTLFNAKKYFKGHEKVLVKPNWIIAEHYTRGNVTSTETVEGIVKYLISECKIASGNIIVGDGGYPSSTDECMQINDIFRLQSTYGIQVRNLNNEKMIEKTIQNPLALSTVKMAEIVDQVDVIISVPSLKTHSMAVTTLAMKNLMGLILPKGIMHSKLPKKIADLCSVIRNKMRFSIIDGYIGSDGSEEGGNPVKMDLLLLSEDPVALDTVGSAVIGYYADQVTYLGFAEKKCLGSADLSKIEVIGPSIAQVQKKFDR